MRAPSVEETIRSVPCYLFNLLTRSNTPSILRGTQLHYELEHHVVLTYEALLAAARLADRFIPDRFLPDKAFDLIDEACANVSVRLQCGPEELFRLREERKRLNREMTALKADPRALDSNYKAQIEAAIRREQDISTRIKRLKDSLVITEKLRKELLHMMRVGEKMDKRLHDLRMEELVKKNKGDIELAKRKLHLDKKKLRIEKAERLTRRRLRLREDRYKRGQDIAAVEKRGVAYLKELQGARAKAEEVKTALQRCKKKWKKLGKIDKRKLADLKTEDAGKGTKLLQDLYQLKTAAKSLQNLGGMSQAFS